MKDEKRAKELDAVIKNAEVELPDVLIHEEIHRMLDEFEYQLQPMGMTLDQYLARLKKNKEELEKDWEPQAEKRVTSALALTELAKKEGIEVTSEEIEKEANKTLQYYKNTKDIEKNIDMESLYNYSKSLIENEKVFDYLEKL
jgi:trigger factor